MIYFIAPYSKQFLGASRKIELLLGILTKIDSEVILINSWVDNENVASHIDLIVDGEQAGVRQYFLPAKSKNRLVYSLINYFELHSIQKQLIRDIGKPDKIWLYNCYFLETHLALKLKNSFGCQLIFECEDSCFSRARGFNPKPYLDNMAWKRLMNHFDHAFAVNLTLAKEMMMNNNNNNKVDLLPGLISSELVRICDKPENKPFSRVGNRIKIGYFGGLSEEKGANMLIDLFRVLSDNFEFIITGTGDMEGAIESISQTNSERFRYYGRVSNDALVVYISEVDVFLNPHQSVEEMGNGVFPFKIMEAIASKRMIISTSLARNEDFEETLQGIVFLEYNIDLWKSTLENANRIYLEREEIIRKSSEKAIALFSENAIIERIKLLY